MLPWWIVLSSSSGVKSWLFSDIEVSMFTPLPKMHKKRKGKKQTDIFLHHVSFHGEDILCIVSQFSIINDCRERRKPNGELPAVHHRRRFQIVRLVASVPLTRSRPKKERKRRDFFCASSSGYSHHHIGEQTGEAKIGRRRGGGFPNRSCSPVIHSTAARIRPPPPPAAIAIAIAFPAAVGTLTPIPTATVPPPPLWPGSPFVPEGEP